MKFQRGRRTTLRRLPSPARNRRAAFSLLEVLIAMMILSVGAASVLALFAAAASTHRRAIDRTHAALVAERVFAEIQVRYTTGKTVEVLGREIKTEIPPQMGDYAWEAFLYLPGADRGGLASPGGAAADSFSEDELFVRVLVRWKQSGQARAQSFFTILLPRGAGLEREFLQPRRRSPLLGR